MSKCPDCGAEMEPSCPVEGCDEDVEVYSRVVGYYRPTQNWNEGKREEYEDRAEFDKDKALKEDGE